MLVRGEMVVQKQSGIYCQNCQRESFLDEVDGTLIRVTSNIAVDVFHDGPSGREVLFEEKQVKRGKEKQRLLGASFAEKIKNDADPETEVWKLYLDKP